MPPQTLQPGETWLDYGFRVGWVDMNLYANCRANDSVNVSISTEINRRYLLELNASNSEYLSSDNAPRMFSFSGIGSSGRESRRASREDSPGNGNANPMQPTKELLKEISAGVKKVYESSNKRESVRREQIGEQKEKKAEYMRITEQTKWRKLSTYQIINSEIPFPLERLNPKRWQEVQKMGYCDEFGRVEPAGQYIYSCRECGVQTGNPASYFFQLGHLYCGAHVKLFEVCIGCKTLKSIYTVIKTFDGQNVHICNSCVRGRATCAMCGEKITSAYMERRRCQKCIDREFHDEGSARKFSYGLKWMDSQKGSTYKSKRMFSCELEAMTPYEDFAHRLNKTLPKEIGIGTDGSVGVRGQKPYGFEVQTPRLAGKKGEELIERVVAGIKSIDPKLDETCGMHIHLDGEGVMPKSRNDYPLELVQLLKSYIVFEDAILSFLPYSRRGNDYCRPLTDSLQLSDLDTIESLEDAEQLWYREETPTEITSAKGHHYHSSRYFGANFHSLLANRHFEVRFHSGTLNRRKILEWANLHALILDACAEGKVTNAIIKEYVATSRLNERTNMLFDLIGLSESSKQWFRNRQKQFGDKKNGENELKSDKKNKEGMVELTTHRSLVERYSELQVFTDEI